MSLSPCGREWCDARINRIINTVVIHHAPAATHSRSPHSQRLLPAAATRSPTVSTLSSMASSRVTFARIALAPPVRLAPPRAGSVPYAPEVRPSPSACHSNVEVHLRRPTSAALEAQRRCLTSLRKPLKAVRRQLCCPKAPFQRAERLLSLQPPFHDAVSAGPAAP